jgi:uncharacterized membrane protein YeaQ/YmgE (transglycosylase-associated protein family)
VIALSNSFLLFLIALWCILGGFVGLCCGKLARLLNGHVPSVLNVILGALGSIAGAYYSGSLTATRPPSEAALWMRKLDLLLGDHQEILAVLSAGIVVFIANLIEKKPAELR